jgi:hypothetical protein
MLSFFIFYYSHKTKNKGKYMKYKKTTSEKLEDLIFIYQKN